MAVGEGDKKIIFTSHYDDEFGGDTNGDGAGTSPSAGDWEWLHFKNSSGSKLENVVVRYGGKYHTFSCYSNPSFTNGMVKVENGEINIKNSLIEQSYTRGIWLDNSSGTIEDSQFLNNGSEEYLDSAAIYIEGQDSGPIIKNSTFKNDKIGIWIENKAAPTIENNIFEDNQISIKTNTLLAAFSGNTAQNNNLNGILVSGFGFSEGVSQVDWKLADLPYVFESSAIISFGQTLNIKPGVIIKFKSGNSRIYVNGILKAEGSSDKKIVFTSFNDDDYAGDTNNDGNSTQPFAGYWDFISFSASSTNSILDNIIVKYGGWYKKFAGSSGAVKIDNANVTISNSVFENNLTSGLELNNCTTTIENTTFKNHRAKYNYNREDSKGLLAKNATPVFTSTAFNNNYYGIYIESGDCPDLSGVTFGTDENFNTKDIHPSSCKPIE